jgi:hypothetical protein
MTMAQALNHEWLAGPSSQQTESQRHGLGGDSVWEIESLDDDYNYGGGSGDGIADADLDGHHYNGYTSGTGTGTGVDGDDRRQDWSRPMTASGTNLESGMGQSSSEDFSQPMHNLHLDTPSGRKAFGVGASVVGHVNGNGNGNGPGPSGLRDGQIASPPTPPPTATVERMPMEMQMEVDGDSDGNGMRSPNGLDTTIDNGSPGSPSVRAYAPDRTLGVLPRQMSIFGPTAKSDSGSELDHATAIATATTTKPITITTTTPAPVAAAAAHKRKILHGSDNPFFSSGSLSPPPPEDTENTMHTALATVSVPTKRNDAQHGDVQAVVVGQSGQQKEKENRRVRIIADQGDSDIDIEINSRSPKKARPSLNPFLPPLSPGLVSPPGPISDSISTAGPTTTTMTTVAARVGNGTRRATRSMRSNPIQVSSPKPNFNAGTTMGQGQGQNNQFPTSIASSPISGRTAKSEGTSTVGTATPSAVSSPARRTSARPRKSVRLG